jgi:hypothetical protein
MAAHGSAATDGAVERNLMRHLILGSIATGTLALIVGCGTKHADAPAAATSNNNVTETKPETDDKTPAPVADTKPAAKQEEARIVATWEAKLHYYEEPGKGSKTGTCAVAGQVRLFAAGQDKPQAADGELSVMLYDCSPETGFDEPPLIYEWRIDADSLKSFLADKAEEYTFLLPWDAYKKEVTKARIDVKYTPKNGNALLTKSEILTLDQSEMKVHGMN